MNLGNEKRQDFFLCLNVVRNSNEHFEDLKSKLLLGPMFNFPNFIKRFEVHTYASDFVIGGIIMQKGHLITFETKNF
jgi:hypothetical protein